MRQGIRKHCKMCECKTKKHGQQQAKKAAAAAQHGKKYFLKTIWQT